MKITENADLTVLDISSEVWRRYTFPDGTQVEIQSPTHLLLHTSEYLERHPHSRPAWGGMGHRVVDADGVAHYIPRGWIHLEWFNRDDTVRVNF